MKQSGATRANDRKNCHLYLQRIEIGPPEIIKKAWVFLIKTLGHLNKALCLRLSEARRIFASRNGSNLRMSVDMLQEATKKKLSLVWHISRAYILNNYFAPIQLFLFCQ